MDIGFGRVTDRQPPGTPDKNPVLNAVDIAGTISVLTRLWPGYIIRNADITVCLTDSDMNGMKYTPLFPRAKIASKPFTTARSGPV